MRLYHGSNVEVREPRVLEPSHALDFGPGFYTTLNRDQAVHTLCEIRGGRMTERQYVAFLAILVVPPLVAEIGKHLDVSEAMLYRSEFYTKLADERLKLWHYSPVMLGEMFVEAEKTGVIPYPEEA